MVIPWLSGCTNAEMKMMFEVCTSLRLDKTNLFLLPFLHATGLAEVNLGEGDNLEKNL